MEKGFGKTSYIVLYLKSCY